MNLMRRWFWPSMLAIALGCDIAFIADVSEVAAYVKSRHGFFDHPPPLESDRKIESVAAGLASLSPDGTRVFVLGENRLVVRTLDGQVLWKADINTAGQYAVPPAVAPDGTAYVLARNETVAFDRDGTKRWSVSIEGQQTGWPIRSFLVGPAGELYAGGSGLWCLSPDGAVRWHLSSTDQEIVALERAPDDTVLVRKEFRGGMRVGFDGVIRATMPLVAPLTVDDGLMVTYAGGDRYVATIAADGQEIRRVNVDQGPFAASLGADGTVYVAAGALYAFSPDGKTRWRFRPRDVLRSKPIVDDDGDIVVGGGRRVFALRPDGILRWQVDLLQGAASSLRLTTLGKDIFVWGSFSGGTRLLRLSNGAQ
jgi:outer membrane protein assembly factor BamB